MGSRKIASPMGWGNGAHVVHKLLESHIPEYRVISYNPYWTLFPFALGMAAPTGDADLVHTAPEYGIFFHKRNIPLILTFHGFSLDRWLREYSTLAQSIHCATDLNLFTRLSVQKADVITAVSHYIADLARKELNISKPIKIIYNGIDTDRFIPARNSKPDRREIRVFFSGNLKRRKGAHWLPAIAGKLNDNVHILYTRGLQTRHDLPPSTNLKPIGTVSHDQMPGLYRDMDMLVMPSVREGFGLGVAEAMACGLPVVASDCSSLPELLDQGKGGFLCPVGDVDAFAEKINMLADDPELRRRMGEYNRAKVEKMFRLQTMIDNYKLLFEETLDLHKSARA